MVLSLSEKQGLKINTQKLGQLKTLGLAHLEKGDFFEAVKVYKQILLEYPNDVESYMLLGDLYLANEDYPSAEKLYEKALTFEPENTIIQRRLKLSTIEYGNRSSQEIPTDSDSVSKILQEITGRENPISEDEIQSAANLLNEIVHNENPAKKVADNLDQIDSLLPALIELNIRQAKNDRRFDLVNMLQALQESVAQLLGHSERISSPLQTSDTAIEFPKNDEQVLINNALFLLPDQKNVSQRMQTCKEALESRNIQTRLLDNSSNLKDFKPDLVIASSPHIQSSTMENLANYSAQHVPIILDLDDDFEYMPINHPNYSKKGLGSLEKSRSYMAAMLFSNLITVPGEAIANHIRESGYRVEVVPFGWSNKSDQWLKPSPKRSSVNIGLVGIQGNYEDVQQYRRIIVRVMREYPLTRLVVCGDSVTYKLFENVAELRRVFLPSIPDEDMSYVFSQMDILLLPMNNTPYHLNTTDELIMQAGVKAIPWIASPMPDIVRWQAGGVTAESSDEWHSYLRQFVQDKDLRISLGQAGRKMAVTREKSFIGKQWLKVVNSLFF